MEKLNVMDRSFLRMESPRHPFHVAGLMILRLPENISRSRMRKLVAWGEQLNTLWPVLNKKLADPEDLSKGWILEDNFQSARHVMHYALPPPGRMDDLLKLVSRVHERPLDRSIPLWELHIIEGLRGDRLAVYCKVHHAIVDGAGGMKMLNTLFTTSPNARIKPGDIEPVIKQQAERQTLLQDLGDIGRGLLEQSRAIPQLSSLFASMGLNALRGTKDAMPLPFTAPRSIFNTKTDSARRIVLCDLPFSTVHGMARRSGGTINDVLLAICGGALRRYLLSHAELPKKSLVAGLPVSIRREDADAANQLSFILCPFFTDEGDDLRRLRRVVRTTGKAKAELARMSTAAGQDFSNLLLMPTVILTLTGTATRVTPAVNAIFSNVRGSQHKLYVQGLELESLYPLSVVTDGLCINLTVVSYDRKLCFAITSCPTQQPGIENLGTLLTDSYRALQQALRKEKRGRR